MCYGTTLYWPRFLKLVLCIHVNLQTTITARLFHFNGNVLIRVHGPRTGTSLFWRREHTRSADGTLFVREVGTEAEHSNAMETKYLIDFFGSHGLFSDLRHHIYSICRTDIDLSSHESEIWDTPYGSCGCDVSQVNWVGCTMWDGMMKCCYDEICISYTPAKEMRHFHRILFFWHW